jgi:hypothetical protein
MLGFYAGIANYEGNSRARKCSIVTTSDWPWAITGPTSQHLCKTHRTPSLSCKVDKTMDVLDGARKHLRLTSAAQEIIMFQQQIRSYRDTIQLSLQTVTLWDTLAIMLSSVVFISWSWFSWNLVTFKESTNKIIPNLDEMHESTSITAW